MSAPPARRYRHDRCPGALRPWPAKDGLLVRLRLVGGRLTVDQLRALIAVAEQYGDGRLHLTARANLQIRALPGADGALEPAVLDAIEETGLLPSRSHELVRNVLVSPQTGLAGGRIDLRPVSADLDRLLLADRGLAGLPGRFLFVLDDGRGDLVSRPADLGLVALDNCMVQLRVGDGWGPVVLVAEAASALAGLAQDFCHRRGSGPNAAWHVVELNQPLCPSEHRDPRVPVPTGALPHGRVPGGRHVAVPGGLDRAEVESLARLAAPGSDLVITPWRGVLIPTPPTSSTSRGLQEEH